LIRALVIILIMFLGLTVQAQISISVDIEQDTVGIGDLNNMTIKVVTPDPSWVKAYSLQPLNEIKPVVSFYADDSLDLVTNAEFDYLDINSEQPVILNTNNFQKQPNGQFVHTNISRFIAWDIGQFMIPNVELTLDTVGGKQFNVMPLQPSSLIVMPPTDVVTPDSTEMIAPILPIIKEEKTLEDWKWLFYVWLFFALAGALLFFFLRKQKKVGDLQKEEVEVIRPSHEVAFERLDDLEAEELWQQGKVKEYQTELTYTIREYLENRFGIQALESTTGEINNSLKEVDFDPKHTTNLNNILQIADMVKFAKAKPDASIHQEFMEKARSFVKDTLFIPKEDNNELAD